jgi:hypothetical protein
VIAKGRRSVARSSKRRAPKLESSPNDVPTLDVTRAVIPHDACANYFGRILAHDGNVYAVGGAYRNAMLLRSTDGGHNFEAMRTPDTPGLRDIHIHDGKIWVVGEHGTIAQTADDGATWRDESVPDKGCVYTIERAPDNRLWIGGTNGLLLRAKPKGGFEPVKHASKENVFAIYFDPKDGRAWLCGIEHLQRFTANRFRMTNLRGRPSIAQLVRLPSGTLVAAGRGGVIARSTTNGRTWQRVAVGVTTDLEAVAYTPYGLVVVGDKVLVSNDDAQSFDVLDGDFSAHVWAVAFVPGALLLGGTDALYRIPTCELAKLLQSAYKNRDKTLAALAERVEARDDGAELVLEDALRERELW